ncbi:MAG: FMN-binding protein [Bacteroidales bacterium]|nr:FMN-binding protein [Bacteroidales bacterium]
MKKTLLLLVAIVFAVTACDKGTYVDGTYAAEYDELDSHGWQAFVEFTLTEDVISEVDFDYLNADGLRKSEDTAYQSRMFSIVGVGPVQFIPGIESQIANATIVPQFDSIDGFSGATSSSHNATELVKAALDAAKDGEPTSIVVPQPEPAE